MTDPSARATDTSPPPPAPSAHQAAMTDDPEKRTAEAKNAFLASLNSVGSSADASLQRRAADIAANSAALSRQQAQLEASTAALAKETDEFAKIADDARGKLKEIGDVQNWAEVMERELLVLEETMRIVEEDGEGKGVDGDFRGGRGGREDASTEIPPWTEGEREGKGKKKKRRWW